MIITRKEAIEQGLTRYFDGKPCKKGHISEKHTTNYTCVICHKEKQKKLYEENPEKYKSARKLQYWTNPEQSRKKSRDWREINSDKVKESKAIYYKNNSEKLKNKAKLYQKLNSELLKDKSKLKYEKLTVEQKTQIVEKRRKKLLTDKNYRSHTYEKAKIYRNKNKDSVRSHKVNYHARKKAAVGIITIEVIELRHQQQKNRCYYCDDPYNDAYHIDHMIPLARGGTNEPHNICISCISCNLRKHTKMPWDFLRLIASTLSRS